VGSNPAGRAKKSTGCSNAARFHLRLGQAGCGRQRVPFQILELHRGRHPRAFAANTITARSRSAATSFACTGGGATSRRKRNSAASTGCAPRAATTISEPATSTEKLSKQSAAAIQLQRAIVLFLDHQDYISAIDVCESHTVDESDFAIYRFTAVVVRLAPIEIPHASAPVI